MGSMGTALHNGLAGVSSFFKFFLNALPFLLLAGFIYLIFKNSKKVDKVKNNKLLNFISVAVYLSLKDVFEIIKKIFKGLGQAGAAISQHEKEEQEKKNKKEEKTGNKPDYTG